MNEAEGGTKCCAVPVFPCDDSTTIPQHEDEGA